MIADGVAAPNGQNWTEFDVPADGNYCQETWALTIASSPVTTHQRCVRLRASAQRNMHTGVNDSSDNTKWADINLNYRKFQVTTGWRIPSTAAASPGLQDFAGVKVDFSAFERAAQTYTGALYGLAMAGSAAAIGALAMSF